MDRIEIFGLGVVLAFYAVAIGSGLWIRLDMRRERQAQKARD